MVNYYCKLNITCLIKRGGGTEPNETRQPAKCTVPIPAGL